MREQHYSDKVLAFADATALPSEASSHPPWERFFLPYLAPGQKLLDLGCGDGHSSLIFLKHGLSCTLVDGSIAQCQLARRRLRASAYSKTSEDVHHLRFDHLLWSGEFDAIWASASLVHVPHAELPKIFRLLYRALKPQGLFYASFREGSDDGPSLICPVQFSEMNLALLQRLAPGFSCIDLYRTACPKEASRFWVHYILRAL